MIFVSVGEVMNLLAIFVAVENKFYWDPKAILAFTLAYVAALLHMNEILIEWITK